MPEQILIVYYTRSKNTQIIAKLIQEQVGGDLYEVKPKVPYPPSYDAVVKQAKTEIQAGYKPPLKTRIDHIETFDTIFIGSPNWWSTMAPPMATFLSENDLSGKTVVPFCTHGGGGLGNMDRDIAVLCPQSTMLEGFEIYGSGGADAKSAVIAWLNRIDMK
ncbi:MAG: hypothetical protein JEZ00_06775 [Anaerolineaceae bacterium]|nr:hypothetical protein [Anaerolineaceae bacterium]